MIQIKSTKSWNETPDMMSPQDYADVIGCSLRTAREHFKKKGFPKKVNGKVSKQEIMRYLGILKTEIDVNTVYSLLLDIKREIDFLTQSQTQKLELLKKVI